MGAPCNPLTPCPTHLSHLAAPWVVSSIITSHHKQAVFLRSVSCPGQLLNLKGGDAVGVLIILAKSERSVGTLGTQDLRLASEVGVGLV